MENKIIQIAVALGAASNCGALFALDSEGNIYELNLNRNGETWQEVINPIKQTEESK